MRSNGDIVAALMGDEGGVKRFRWSSFTILRHLLLLARQEQNQLRASSGSRHIKESVPGRRLWYRDSYAQWHEDRHAGGRSGMSAKWALMILAGCVVIEPMIHLNKPVC
jgi:hypothetical protein